MRRSLVLRRRLACVRSRLALARVSRRGSVVWARDVVGTVRVRCSSPIRARRVCTFGRARDLVIDWLRRLCAARIVCSWSIHRRIVRHRRITRPDYTGAVEGRRFWSCRHFGPAMVHRRPLGAVGARHLLMLGLHRGRGDVALAQGSFLSSIGARVDSAVATVIGDAIYGHVVHYGPVVNIVNVSYVHAIDGLVVIEITTTPVSALVAVTGITEAVVDAAIEADVRTPVSGMPDEGRTAPSPIARCPQKADLGG